MYVCMYVCMYAGVICLYVCIYIRVLNIRIRIYYYFILDQIVNNVDNVYTPSNDNKYIAR